MKGRKEGMKETYYGKKTDAATERSCPVYT